MMSMSQTEVLAFPQFAPLSTPFVKFLLERQETLKRDRLPLATSPQEQVEQALRHFQKVWSLFEQRVSEKRQQTYDLMKSAVQVDVASGEQYISPNWLRETLSNLMPTTSREKIRRKKDIITSQTLSMWSEKHILRHRAWGQFEAQTVAGVITARLLDETRERSWLPSVVDANEPYWWCYSQAMPVNGVSCPIVPCPIPLPENIPPSTLLWTPWAGASWDPGWLQIGYLGAVRWAGTTFANGRIQWNMSEADLKKWDPEILSLDMGFLRHNKETLDAIAHLTLLRLAATRLHSSANSQEHLI